VNLPDVVSKELRIEDAEWLSSDAIREGIDFIIEQKMSGHAVLVCCSGGFSRSVAFAVAALREVEGMSLSEALATVREHHPEAQPHPLIWESLCAYYQEPYGDSRSEGRRGRRFRR
jgi:protein-tyrosine phosphatase